MCAARWRMWHGVQAPHAGMPCPVSGSRFCCMARLMLPRCLHLRTTVQLEVLNTLERNDPDGSK